jgi:Domain of unknown function (DUF3883)
MSLIDEYQLTIQNESSALEEELDDFEIQRKKYLTPAIFITGIFSAIFWFIMIVLIAKIPSNGYIWMVVLIIVTALGSTDSVKEFLCKKFIYNYSYFFELRKKSWLVKQKIDIVNDAKRQLDRIERIELNKDISGSQLPALKSYLENLEFKYLDKIEYNNYVSNYNRSFGRMGRYEYESYKENYVSSAPKAVSKIDSGTLTPKEKIKVNIKHEDKKPESTFITNLSTVFSNVKSVVRNKNVINLQANFQESELLDYYEISKNSIELGLQGELFVLKQERKKLIAMGKIDLANNVEHISAKGNQYGYDILSYNNLGDEIFIEVKTSKQGIDSSFYLTSNELLKLNSGPNYFIYRVFNFNNVTKEGEVYVIDFVKGDIDNYFNLEAQVYLVSPIKK